MEKKLAQGSLMIKTDRTLVYGVYILVPTSNLNESFRYKRNLSGILLSAISLGMR